MLAFARSKHSSARGTKSLRGQPLSGRLPTVLSFHHRTSSEALQLRLHRYKPNVTHIIADVRNLSCASPRTLAIQLPDKEFRYLRTIIVIADIDRGLCSASTSTLRQKYRPHLTFRHWSGITPHTSSYEFAGSCVFDKQSPGNNYLQPLLREAGLIANVRPLFCRVP